MSIKDQYDFENLVNEAERLVFEELEKQVDTHDYICSCQECMLDMAAFALNQVKPYYRVSLLGSLYARSIGDDYREEVIRAVQDAVDKIQSNPSHD